MNLNLFLLNFIAAMPVDCDFHIIKLRDLSQNFSKSDDLFIFSEYLKREDSQQIDLSEFYNDTFNAVGNMIKGWDTKKFIDTFSLAESIKLVFKLEISNEKIRTEVLCKLLKCSLSNLKYEYAYARRLNYISKLELSKDQIKELINAFALVFDKEFRINGKFARFYKKDMIDECMKIPHLDFEHHVLYVNEDMNEMFENLHDGGFELLSILLKKQNVTEVDFLDVVPNQNLINGISHFESVKTLKISPRLGFKKMPNNCKELYYVENLYLDVPEYENEVLKNICL